MKPIFESQCDSYTSVITNRPSTPLVIEVGVSETMQKLERDAQMWLLCLRNEVRVCILICLDETPSYHMPPPGIIGPDTDIDEEAAAAEAAMFQNRIAVNSGSPLIYRGYSWVNSLTGRVSVYKAAPDFSDIVCISVMDMPLELADNVTTDQRIGLWYSCFLPTEDLSLMHVEDMEVVTLHDMIRNAAADTSRLRYIEYMKTTVGHL
ncbi:hypothetical protein V1520DRAFT_375463 [Lipomyces starkeyi]|uniref:Uncharacterized protein n=1 Tax=Lipomyces starkeyi NRRL Y-11557 TaxID=675824 RepID=A0A1E3PWL6_LIPST|nr:hypothetical protein LIPSTDRAFT_66079 [Lipomyces starkeyi NRRL Y-11557]